MKRFLLLHVWFALCLSPAVGSATQAKPVEADMGIAIEQVGVLVFPSSMLQSGIYSGEVRAAISVDQDGNLTDCLLVSYSEQAFADAALAAIKRWKYEPAMVHGRAQSSRADVFFSFHDQGVFVQSLPGAMDRRFIENMLEGRYVYQACQLRDLDRIPTPVHVVSPAINRDSQTHTVVVGFYIDEEGKVRLPSVSRDAADDYFAAASVRAVEQWRFEPPMRKGRPALVYAEQEFHFNPKK